MSVANFQLSIPMWVFWFSFISDFRIQPVAADMHVIYSVSKTLGSSVVTSTVLCVFLWFAMSLFSMKLNCPWGDSKNLLKQQGKRKGKIKKRRSIDMRGHLLDDFTTPLVLQPEGG